MASSLHSLPTLPAPAPTGAWPGKESEPAGDGTRIWSRRVRLERRQRPLSEQQLLLWGPNGDLAPCSWPELLEHEYCPCCVVSDDALGLSAPSGS